MLHHGVDGVLRSVALDDQKIFCSDRYTSRTALVVCECAVAENTLPIPQYDPAAQQGDMEVVPEAPSLQRPRPATTDAQLRTVLTPTPMEQLPRIPRLNPAKRAETAARRAMLFNPNDATRLAYTQAVATRKECEAELEDQRVLAEARRVHDRAAATLAASSSSSAATAPARRRYDPPPPAPKSPTSSPKRPLRPRQRSPVQYAPHISRELLRRSRERAERSAGYRGRQQLFHARERQQQAPPLPARRGSSSREVRPSVYVPRPPSSQQPRLQSPRIPPPPRQPPTQRVVHQSPPLRVTVQPPPPPPVNKRAREASAAPRVGPPPAGEPKRLRTDEAAQRHEARWPHYVNVTTKKEMTPADIRAYESPSQAQLKEQRARRRLPATAFDLGTYLTDADRQSFAPWVQPYNGADHAGTQQQPAWYYPKAVEKRLPHPAALPVCGCAPAHCRCVARLLSESPTCHMHERVWRGITISNTPVFRQFMEHTAITPETTENAARRSFNARARMARLSADDQQVFARDFMLRVTQANEKRCRTLQARHLPEFLDAHTGRRLRHHSVGHSATGVERDRPDPDASYDVWHRRTQRNTRGPRRRTASALPRLGALLFQPVIVAEVAPIPLHPTIILDRIAHHPAVPQLRRPTSPPQHPLLGSVTSQVPEPMEVSTPAYMPIMDVSGPSSIGELPIVVSSPNSLLSQEDPREEDTVAAQAIRTLFAEDSEELDYEC